MLRIYKTKQFTRRQIPKCAAMCSLCVTLFSEAMFWQWQISGDHIHVDPVMRLHSSEWPHAQLLLSAETLSLPSGLSLNTTNGHFLFFWGGVCPPTSLQLLHSEPHLPSINYGACKCVNTNFDGRESKAPEGSEANLKSDGKSVWQFSGQAASHGAGCCIMLLLFFSLPSTHADASSALKGPCHDTR